MEETYLKAEFIALVKDFSDSSGKRLSVSLIKQNVLLFVTINIFDNNGHLHGQVTSLLHSVKILADLPSKVESLQLRLMILQGVCKSSMGWFIQLGLSIPSTKRENKLQPTRASGWL